MMVAASWHDTMVVMTITVVDDWWHGWLNTELFFLSMVDG